MKSKEALQFITESIEKGLTVYIATHLKNTAISPKTFAAWKKSGHELFKIDAEGNLRMARGKAYDIIVTKTTSLVKIIAQ